MLHYLCSPAHQSYRTDDKHGKGHSPSKVDVKKCAPGVVLKDFVERQSGTGQSGLVGRRVLGRSPHHLEWSTCSSCPDQPPDVDRCDRFGLRRSNGRHVSQQFLGQGCWVPTQWTDLQLTVLTAFEIWNWDFRTPPPPLHTPRRRSTKMGSSLYIKIHKYYC